MAVLTGAVLAAVAACGGSAGSGGGSSSGSAPAARTLTPAPGGGAHPAAAWPTYGRDAARSDVAAGVATPGPLTVSWHAHLDGAVYGQPLLVGTMVIAATENDSIYGLDQATGRVMWRRHVGTPVPLADLPCGNIDPLGITGTPVYNPASGLVYAVAETSGYHHVLVGVSVRDGSVQVERDIAAPDGQPRYDQQRPGLAIAAGRVYVAFGGLYGDCGPYRGSVVGVPLSGAGPLISYVVPTPREGAVWGTAGPVTGPDGTMYVSVGNGEETGTSFDDSDSVTALSPACAGPASSRRPPGPMTTRTTWTSAPPSPRCCRTGCCWRTASAAPRTSSIPLTWAASAARSRRRRCVRRTAEPPSAGSVVHEPCAQGGLAAVDTAGSTIRVRWHGPVAAQGSPVIGGGAVWVTDYQAGRLYELDQATGATRASLSLGSTLPHFSSMSMTGSHAFLGTMEGVIAVGGV